MAERTKNLASPQSSPPVRSSGTQSSQTARTPARRPSQRRRATHGVPRSTAGGVSVSNRQILQLQRAAGNQAVGHLLTGGEANQTAGIETPEHGAEQAPSDPIARGIAIQKAQEQAREITKSDEPEFARSVQIAPASGAEEEAGPQRAGFLTNAAEVTEQTANLKAAQAAEQGAELAQAGESANQLEKLAQVVEEEEPTAEEEAIEAQAGAAEEQVTLEGRGKDVRAEAPALDAVAGQALALLSTRMADTAGLASNRVIFAPRAEERSRETRTAFQSARKRAASEAVASSFLARNAVNVQNLLALGLSGPPRILAAADVAKAAIDTTVAQNIDLVTAQIADVRAQVQAQAAAAKQQLIGQCDAITAANKTSTEKARSRIQASYDGAKLQLEKQEKDQVTGIDTLYTSWDPKFRGAGVEVGGEAVAIARGKADTWLDQRNGKSTILDGPIHDNRLEARADAAVKVGDEYRKSLEKSANEQADKLAKGKPEVVNAVRDTAAQARTSLQEQLSSVIESLTASEQSGLAQLEQTTNSMVSAVESSLETTLRSLNEQKSVQANRLTEYGEAQKATIDEQAAQVINSLMTGAGQAAEALNQSLIEFLESGLATEAPDQEALTPILWTIQAETDTQAATMLQQTEEGIRSSETGITVAGEETSQAVNLLGKSAVDQVNSAAVGYALSVARLQQQATDGFCKLKEGYAKTTEGVAASAEDGFKKAEHGLQEAFTKLSSKVKENFTLSRNELRTNLRGSFPKLRENIKKYADEAAAQVQPRWKKVLKWVITIVVIIAVVAITILSAGSLGPVGLVLLGATLGALAGAATTIGHNLVDGKKWSDGVVKMMIVGAIGGACGGLGGVLFKGIASVGLRIGLEAGLDVVGGIVGEVTGSLVVGESLNWSGILFGALIGAGVGAGLGIGFALKGKIKLKPKVEAPTPTVRPSVEAPAPSVRPAVKVYAPPSRVRGFLERTGILARKGPAARVEAPTARPAIETPTSKTATPEAPPGISRRPTVEPSAPPKSRHEGPEPSARSDIEPPTTPAKPIVLESPLETLGYARPQPEPISPLRRPRGFETGRYRPGRRVRAGTLEELDPTARPVRGRQPRAGAPSREAQLKGLTFPTTAEANAARRELVRNLGPRPSGATGESWQGHHLIPWELRSHPAIERVGRLAWNINGRSNGSYLPTSSSVPGAGSRTVHVGSHPQYTARVRAGLDRLSAMSLSNVQLLNQLRRLREELRAGLQNGTIPLN